MIAVKIKRRKENLSPLKRVSVLKLDYY